MSAIALREVRLYGSLGREFGRVFRLAVLTPAEAVRALCAVLPGFERAFLRDGRAQYHVFVGRGSARHDIALEASADPVARTEPIRIVPVVAGAKKGGLLQIILGAALMIFAPYAAGALFATGSSVGLAVGVSTIGVSLGKALILGGIIQLLSPQPKRSSTPAPENLPSYGFDGPVNNTSQGGPVPLAYGRVIVGSTQISAGLSTEDIVVAAGTPLPTQTLPPHQPLDPMTDAYENLGA